MTVVLWLSMQKPQCPNSQEELLGNSTLSRGLKPAVLLDSPFYKEAVTGLTKAGGHEDQKPQADP